MNRFWIFLVGTLLMASPVLAEPSAMLRLLEELHRNGTISDDAYAALKQAAEDEARARTEAPPAAAMPMPAVKPAARPDTTTAAVDPEPTNPPATTADKPDTGVKLGTGGLEFETADGDFSLALGGRLHLDAARYANDKPVRLGSGTLVRRARISLSGTFWRDWSFSAGADFAGNEVDLKSNYIRYEAFDPLRISMGLFKEPFSLEEVSSSNDSLLMERSIVNVFPPGRNIGLGVSSYGDYWTVSGGVFGGPRPDDGGGEIDESWSLVGRGTVTPIRDGDHVVHVGAGVAFRDYDDGDEIRFRARPDSRVTDIRLVDTGTIDALENDLMVGAELAWIYGPLSVQGEYIRELIHRRRSMTDTSLDGWYAQAGYVLTGESRAYKRKSGRIGTVTPDHPVSEGGFGAWEIGLRYSHLDLTDSDIRGGEQDILTVGLNWYVNPNLRFMANYVDVLDVRRPGDPIDGEEPRIYQVRGQVNF